MDHGYHIFSIQLVFNFLTPVRAIGIHFLSAISFVNQWSYMEELSATQEEMGRKEKEYLKRIEELEGFVKTSKSLN